MRVVACTASARDTPRNARPGPFLGLPHRARDPFCTYIPLLKYATLKISNLHPHISTGNLLQTTSSFAASLGGGQGWAV